MSQNIFKKTALVLEGGGFRGIFTAGVLEVFLKNNMIFDFAVGVSAGASYGVSYVSQQSGRNLLVNQFISDKRYAGLGNLIKKRSYFSWDFIFEEIPTNMVSLDYEAFKNSITKFWIGTTNCVTGKPEYFLLNPANKSEFKTILAASCSLPLIAPKVNYQGNNYMDGGLTESIPSDFAFLKGNNKAIVILTRPRGYVKAPLKNKALFKWVYRKHPKLVELILSRPARYNESIKKLEALEKEGKVFIIQPEKEIAVGRLENKPIKTEKVYYNGMRVTEKLLPELLKWLEN